jgi:chromosome segregation ATPase
MSGVDVQTILKQVEELLGRAGELPAEAEQAVGKLLNVVEALSADKQELADEVQRLRRQLEQKKQAKTTAQTNPDGTVQPKPDIRRKSGDANTTSNPARPWTAARSKT